jgi:hypothetical protein
MFHSGAARKIQISCLVERFGGKDWSHFAPGVYHFELIDLSI